MSKIEDKLKPNNNKSSSDSNNNSLNINSSNSAKNITFTKLKKSNTLSKSAKLENYRVLQKNLVYVIGLSEKLASKELLYKYEYFGQYGQIMKIVVNKNKAYYSETQSKPSYSAYISYSNPKDASLAILAVDSIIADDHLIRASFGTTKYCAFYLKNAECTNKDCLYLHSLADDEVIVNKDELTSNCTSTNNVTSKSIFYEQHLLAIKNANIYDPDVKKSLTNSSKKKTVLPNLESIYDKDIVIENDPMFIRKTNSTNFKSKNTLFKSASKCQISSTNNNTNSLSNVSSNYTTPKATSGLKFSKDIFKSITSENNNNTELNVNKSKSQENLFKENRENSENNSDKININTISNLSHTPPIKKGLYTNRDKSRFPFVLSIDDTTLNSDSSNNICNVNKPNSTCNSTVPEYVFDVINKKVSRYTFFKKFEHEFEHDKDQSYFEKSLKCRGKNDSWTDFIFTRINLHDD